MKLNKSLLLSSLLLSAILLQTTTVSASVGVLHKTRSEMFLYEKFGKTENLLDNPARLKGISERIIYNHFDLSLVHAKPYDPVFDKSARDDTLGYNVQAIAPIGTRVAVNLGYNYTQEMMQNYSNSSLDGSYFIESAKAFNRNLNAGLAAGLEGFGLPIKAGYGFKYRHQHDPGEFLSSTSQDYSYINDRKEYRHTLGITQEGWGLWVSHAQEEYFADYNRFREVDFLFQTMEIAVRKIIGEIDRENLTLSGTFSTTLLETRQFDVARPVYQLFIPDYTASLSSYFYYPQQSVAYAAGLELNYTDTQRYDLSGMLWIYGQHYLAKGSGSLEAEIFSFLFLWVEAAVIYAQDTFAGAKSLVLENAFGARFRRDIFSINLFVLPEFNVFSGNQADEIKSFRTGLDVQLNF